MFERLARSALAVGVLAVPSSALAAGPKLTPALVFTHAPPFQKTLMLALLAAMVATAVIASRKLSSGPSLSGGSAFISGLRLGGPLIGTLGATYSALNSALGVANVDPHDLNVLAPGIAESLLVFGLGVLAGSIAVLLHWAIEARIDRRVLKG